MRRVILSMALGVIPFGAPSAHAQTEAPSVSIESCIAAAGASNVALQACKGRVSEPCLERPGGETTAGAGMCFVAEEAAWTAQLNAALARAQTDTTRASFLARSQEAWRAWREAECRYQASLYEGGSLSRVIAANCVADLTADRAIALLYAERTADH
ncbi:MAG TPA: lysozyme inhibitor LprI family protein [Candidatus Binatia bacterium]|nr:lysozyme inhibitor LprI family protein [Candidatus Binatia bacterium]